MRFLRFVGDRMWCEVRRTWWGTCDAELLAMVKLFLAGDAGGDGEDGAKRRRQWSVSS